MSHPDVGEDAEEKLETRVLAVIRPWQGKDLLDNLQNFCPRRVRRLGHSLKTMGPMDFKPHDFEEQRANGTVGVGEAVMRAAVYG